MMTGTKGMENVEWRVRWDEPRKERGHDAQD